MKKRLIATSLLSIGAIALIASCKSIPRGAKPVNNFDPKRYLGNWYEIARLDFKYEKNLNNTMAHYSLKDNGDIKVLNSGYNYKKQEWTSSIGNAKFRGDQSEAALKVSFFGPFYSGYNVIALDDNYQYALVAGKSTDYLWILSREKTIPDAVKQQYLKIASDIGYNTADLVWVEHNMDNPILKKGGE